MENYCRGIESIDGKSLLLEITKLHGSGVQFKVHNVNKGNFKRKCLITLLVLLLNTFSFVCKFVSIQYFSIILIVSIYFIFLILQEVDHDSLLIIPKFGCQKTTKYAVGCLTQFIPWEDIQNIFINEVLSKQRVLFVLTITTKEKLIPLFQDTNPHINGLEIIYQNVQTILG